MRTAAFLLMIAGVAPLAVADSLMQRWVEIYNADDVEALRELLAENVVMMDDTLGTTGEGRDPLIPEYARVMAALSSLQIRPLVR